MSSNKNNIDQLLDYIKKNSNNIFKHNDKYGLQYISKYTYEYIMECLSKSRKEKEISPEDFHTIKFIYTHLYKNESKILDLIRCEPRSIASKFISKKNIREFIFKRDKYKCLRCFSIEKLSIDHIMPIRLGGENKISNLQTLCRSCNSKKRDTFKDYRNG